MRRSPLLAIRLAGILPLAAIAAPAFGQSGAPGGGWPHYAGDHGSTKCTPRNRIDKGNFKDLENLWRWESADKDLKGKTPFRAYDFLGTPLYVDGAVCICTNLCALTPKKRGRKPRDNDPLIEENRRLERVNKRLVERLRQAEVIIDVQKKFAEILGIPLPSPKPAEHDS